MERKKILVIRFSSLGDVVLVHPVIKKLFDNGFNVDLLTKKKYKEIFKYNPYINKILLLENYKKLFHILKVIKANNYVKILDLHKNLRTAFIKLFFFYKTMVYKKYMFRRFLLRGFKVNFLKNNFVVKNYLKPLHKLGLKVNTKDSEYKIFLKEPEKIKNIFKKNMVIIASFARYYTKEWVYYKDLIKILRKKYRIIIIGEGEDYSRAEKLIQKNVFNLCGKLNFSEIIHIINRSKLLITNDSGIMHLGAGSEVPIISIFGSTVRGFGFVPIRKEIIIIENHKLKCRPCDYHGKDNCPKVHFKCMRDISVDRVIKNVSKFVKI